MLSHERSGKHVIRERKEILNNKYNPPINKKSENFQKIFLIYFYIRQYKSYEKTMNLKSKVQPLFFGKLCVLEIFAVREAG